MMAIMKVKALEAPLFIDLSIEEYPPTTSTQARRTQQTFALPRSSTHGSTLKRFDEGEVYRVFNALIGHVYR